MIIVLYEDQRESPPNFGLHHLVARLVLDHCNLDQDVYAFKKVFVDGIPLKGNANVRKRCSPPLTAPLSRANHIFAVYDRDKIHRLLGVDAKTCRAALSRQLIAESGSTDRLEVVFIDRNIESLLTIISEFVPRIIQNESLIRDALDKDILARDRVFIQCAEKTDKATRDKLLQQMPDLARLVRKICEVLQSTQARSP